MNDELREIVASVAYGREIPHQWADGSTTPVLFHVGADWADLQAKARALLAEAERFRAENRELRAIAEEIARDGAQMQPSRLERLARDARALLATEEPDAVAGDDTDTANEAPHIDGPMRTVTVRCLDCGVIVYSWIGRGVIVFSMAQSAAHAVLEQMLPLHMPPEHRLTVIVGEEETPA